MSKLSGDSKWGLIL